MKERKKRDQFPRTSTLPSQSSKYWVKEKDRFIRQLLICDIEDTTSRELVVYFSRLDQTISPTDSDDLSEVIEGVESEHIDLFIHTPGGLVDAVEKFVVVLKQRTKSYRVIVPSWAKSGGTLIALASEKILLGVNSELGPVDPQMMTNFGPVPAEFISDDQTQPPLLRQIAKTNIDRAKELAERYLEHGMLKGKTKEEIKDQVVDKISSATGYGSHGAVIDYSEAKSLRLAVEWLEPSSELWRRVWLLYCLYDFDVKMNDLGKIFEGARYSISRRPVST